MIRFKLLNCAGGSALLPLSFADRQEPKVPAILAVSFASP